MEKLNAETLTYLVNNLTKKIDENTKETAAIHEKLNDQKRLIEKIDKDVTKLSQSDSWLKQWVEEKIEDLKKMLDEEIKLRQQIGISKIFNPLFKNKALIKLIAVFCSGVLLPYLIKDTETLHLIIEKIFSLIH
jgi:uncharacterized protein YhaN